MKLPNFVNSSADSPPKIGHDFTNNKEVQKWQLQKNSFNDKCAPKLKFFIEKKIRYIQKILDIENSL